MLSRKTFFVQKRPSGQIFSSKICTGMANGEGNSGLANVNVWTVWKKTCQKFSPVFQDFLLQRCNNGSLTTETRGARGWTREKLVQGAGRWVVCPANSFFTKPVDSPPPSALETSDPQLAFL